VTLFINSQIATRASLNQCSNDSEGTDLVQLLDYTASNGRLRDEWCVGKNFTIYTLSISLNKLQRTNMMAGKDTTELPPQQEHYGRTTQNRTPAPARNFKVATTSKSNKIKSNHVQLKDTQMKLTVSHKTKITRGNYNRRKENRSLVSSSILNHNILYT
jgi:hypothetical protein